MMVVNKNTLVIVPDTLIFKSDFMIRWEIQIIVMPSHHIVYHKSI